MGVKEDIREMWMPLLGQEIPLAIINTTEALWTREDKRPQIHSKKKLKDGWEFVFVLPPGMTFRQFAGNEEAYRDAIGDVTTEMLHVGKMALLKVTESKIPKKVTFDYNDIETDGIMPILIGYDHIGPVYADLSKVYNILIGGYIGGGKSNIIHCIVNTLLHLPKPPRIVISDFKMLEYDYLSQHVLLVTDNTTTCIATTRLVTEMRNRLGILQQARCVNIEKYNERYKSDPLDYIVLIIDELAELKCKQAQENLETILRLGRAPGYRVILATQRADAKIFGRESFGQCKANLVGRLCFQTSDVVNSRIILDSPEAASLPKIPGRAIWKYGKAMEVQTPYLDPEIAEVMLLEQSSFVRGERLQNRQNNSRMGGDVNRTTSLTPLSFLQSLPEAFTKIIRKQNDKKM
jgi:S-DNA-T family DNA segregation ATPase FtsK/SpoIIIE